MKNKFNQRQPTALIYKRKSGKNLKWRAAIRIDGFPSLRKTFDRKQEAEDWANDAERKIKSGRFKFDQYKNKKTDLAII